LGYSPQGLDHGSDPARQRHHRRHAVTLLPKLGNRHGLVAGATGTGKTVTLMTLAEGFSRLGVPVFLADVKGDVSGLAVPAGAENLLKRAAEIGVADYAPAASPTMFWDLYGKLGHPVRTTVSEMGPTLLARILELNDTQPACSSSCSRCRRPRPAAARSEDLRAMLSTGGRQAQGHLHPVRLVSAQSIGAIQRNLLRLSQDGGEVLRRAHAGLPTSCDHADGRGVINILAADKLVLKPPAVLHLPAVAAVRAVRAAAGSGRRTSPSWCSSSTRRTCCSTTPRRRWCSASNRWCA
jgi:hypothetical protein